MFVYYTGGEKVFLYFSQDLPGDYVPLEDISKALDISANVQAGERPQVSWQPTNDGQDKNILERDHVLE